MKKILLSIFITSAFTSIGCMENEDCKWLAYFVTKITKNPPCNVYSILEKEGAQYNSRIMKCTSQRCEFQGFLSHALQEEDLNDICHRNFIFLQHMNILALGTKRPELVEKGSMPKCLR